MKGILMKPDMIQAAIEGRKTQTRRVIKPQPFFEAVGKPEWLLAALIDKARYQVGETVYIKETIRMARDYPIYESDKEPVMFYLSNNHLQWRWQKPYLSSLFSPQEAARHFITITGVRAERVQEITEEDAITEGIKIMKGTHQAFGKSASGKLELVSEPKPYTARYHFEALWNSINPKYPWESNPWVFAYTFGMNISERTDRENVESV